MNRLGLTAALAVGAWAGAHHTSPAVRAWSPPDRQPADSEPLATMISAPVGADGPVVVLLHGIVASGRSFGASYDRLPAPVVVPDLLGFGGSMAVPTPTYDVDAHVDALAQTLQDVGVAGRPVVLVGHSMGGVLALHHAARSSDVVSVLTLGAPLYDDAEEGLDRIGEADPLAGLLTTGDLAQRVCEWMCEHRDLARRLWPMMAFRWPWPVAADGVLHTWPAYRGSLQSLVLDSNYDVALDVLADRSVPVVLAEGSKDGVPVPGRAQALADRHTNVTTLTVDGADHALPISHPGMVIELIEARLS